MKLFRLIIFFLAGSFAIPNASGQTANASLNILTLNSGQVTLGGVIDLQVTVGNTGPGSILPRKVRAQISIPIAIASAQGDAFQTGLPDGWTITANTGGSITICNGTDVIPAGVQRQIFIKIQGNAIGGPSTINGNLIFSNGSSCTIPGTLPGDNTADNTGTTTIQVIPPSSCTLGVTVSAGTIACNGGTAILTATPGGAIGAVEYSLNGGAFQSGNTFTVNAAGSPYTVTAREVNTPACTATSTAVSITEPAVVQAPSVSIIQPTCSVVNGTITITSATTGLTFSLDGGTYASYPVGGYSVAAGLHTLTAQNASTCTSSVTSVTINAQPVTPVAPATGTITQPTCIISTGSVVLNGLPSGNWIINPGAISGNTSTTTLSGLAAGTYSFTVTNAAGCTSASSADVIINNVPGAPDAPVVSIVQPDCSVATGTITITSPTAGLVFSLDGGAYAPYLAGGYIVASGVHTLIAENTAGCNSPFTNVTVNVQPETPTSPSVNIIQPTCTVATGTITITSAITGLVFSLDGGTYAPYPAGGYTVTAGSSHTLTAQNASGCISSVTSITLNAQPVAPSASASAGIIACFGGTTTITVTASGGTAPFEYSLNGGVFQSANTFTVGTGTYTVTVKDANLCTGVSAGLTVTQPTAISASVSASAFVCNGGTTIISVTATGGTGALQYSLNGGAFQPGNTFTVSTGLQTITVRDANLCTTTATATITQPPALTTSANAGRITQCGGTAVVTVTAAGGIAPYTSGIGTFTRRPGTWSFSVTDAGGCSSTTEVTIEAPGCMNLKIYPNPASSLLNVYHSAAVSGSVMQVFEINGALVISKPVPQNAFQTTVDVSRLAAGSYVLVFWNGNEKKQILFIKTTSI